MSELISVNWKHRQNDQAFIAKRNEFFKEHSQLDPKLVTDHWPLFIGAVPLATLLARYEILKIILNVPGHIVELGSFHGAHLCFMAKVMNSLAPNDPRQIFGFDSFEGLSQFRKEDSVAVDYKGAYKGDQDLLKKVIELHSLEDRIRLVAGNIEQTLPPFVEQHPSFIYSYVYFDTDLFESTRIGLELLWPRLAQGGVMAFDQGYSELFPGEGSALQHFLQKIPGQYECGQFAFARQPTVWIRKK